MWQGRAFYVRFYPGMALIVIVLYALPAWMPSFLMRVHGADPTTVGLRYGVLVLIMGSAGVSPGRSWIDGWRGGGMPTVPFALPPSPASAW